MNIKVNEICFSYPDSGRINLISTEVKAGEITCILGPNGSGKSTFLKCLNRLLPAASGTVYIGSEDIGLMSKKKLACLMGYLPQEPPPDQEITVLDAVLMGRRPHTLWRPGKRDFDLARQALTNMHLFHLADRMLASLSGGEVQRVMLARALAQEAKVLLLDEPTNNLDIRHQLGVMRTVRDLADTVNLAAIVVMHDLNLSARFADKILILSNGEIAAAGIPAGVLTSENIREVYKVESSIYMENGLPHVIVKEETKRLAN
ncbi:MAG: ABC transporter ATP-binding protein [Desulfobacteraceae bacterium]|nr:MAG: ABC transporter ATP-binding protein [Desulfobacteraceae bacterium]